MSGTDDTVTITLDDGRTGQVNPSWLAEAADTVEWRWYQYTHAPDAVSQAAALVELANAMSDLTSFLPGYNLDTGEVDRPGDEH